jgi:hypothetical protein
MTFALGWALREAPTFLALLLSENGIAAGDGDLVIRLQEHADEGGYTDIEVESAGRFFVLIEAKRGWELPAAQQLNLYRHRPAFVRSQAPTKTMLVLSECSANYAIAHLPFVELEGVPICPLTWRNIADLARLARSQSRSYYEKGVLDAVLTYLGGLVSMQRQDSNWVYVVSLGGGTYPGWNISWIDIVAKRSRYFHPFGKNWPKEPPNYIAFRYWGELQSIHHVEDYEVVTDLHSVFPEIPSETIGPTFVYHLGQRFRPDHQVRTGALYRAARVWCLLDTLFTSQTISEAREETDRRISAATQAVSGNSLVGSITVGTSA